MSFLWRSPSPAKVHDNAATAKEPSRSRITSARHNHGGDDDDCSDNADDGAEGGWMSIPVEERWQPTIGPTDHDYKRARRSMARMLRDEDATLDQILDIHFSPYDKKLFMPATSGQHMTEVQRDATDRFYDLLAGRFRGEKADLVTKLTFLYFGLPIEPVNNGLFGGNPDDDLDVPLGWKVEVRAVEPPLHFLAAWDRRNFGRDTGASAEARPLVRPIAVPDLRSIKLDLTSRRPAPVRGDRLRLRGGGTNNAEISDVDAHDDEIYDVEDGHVDSHQEIADYGDEQRLEPHDTILYLYGHQGRIAFCPDKEATFVQAVRRLLGAQHALQAKYTLIQFDQVSDMAEIEVVYKTPTATVNDSLPHRRDGRAWDHLGAHLASDDHRNRLRKGGACCQWFVRLETEPNPTAIQPEPNDVTENRHAAVLTRAVFPDQSGGVAVEDRAYVWFPRSNRRELFDAANWGSNHYDAFLREAVRTLIPAWDPLHVHPNEIYELHLRPGETQRSGDLGPPYTPVPFYGLSGVDTKTLTLMDPRQRDEENVFWDLRPSDADIPPFNLALTVPGLGASSQQAIKAMFHLIEADLDALDPALVKRLESRQHIRESDAPQLADTLLPNAQRVLQRLVAAAIGEKRMKTCMFVRLYMAQHFYDADVGSRPAATKPIHKAVQFPLNQLIPGIPIDDAYIDALNLLLLNVVSRAAPHVVVQPVWTKMRVRPAWSRSLPVPFQLRQPLIKFRELVGSMLKARPRNDVLLDPRVTCIRITQTDTPVRGGADLSRSFVVTPDTTQAEWSLMQRHIISETLEIEIDDLDSHWVRRLDRNLWGPRYGVVCQWRWLMDRESITRLPDPKPAMRGRHHYKNPLRARPVETDDDSLSDDDDVARPFDGFSAAAPPAFATVFPTRLPQESRREKAYISQPSILDTYDPAAGVPPTMPVNAPPLEPFLRVGLNMPTVSKGVLTPTEQMRLQVAVLSLRNVAIERTMACPFGGCMFTCKFDAPKMMREHLADQHLAALASMSKTGGQPQLSMEEKIRSIVKAAGAPSEAPASKHHAHVRARSPAKSPKKSVSKPKGADQCPWLNECGDHSFKPLDSDDVKIGRHIRAHHKAHLDAHDEVPANAGVLAESLRCFGDVYDRLVELSKNRAGANTGGKRGKTASIDKTATIDKTAPPEKKTAPFENPERSRGRTQNPSGGKPNGFERREPSPNWDHVLGTPPAGWSPTQDMYCTRCLRKVPKKTDSGPGGSKGMSTADEVRFHSDSSHSCKTRWGPGSCNTIALPNRSGFVTTAQINETYKRQGLTVTSLKKALATEYPAYVRTFYPYTQAKHNLSRWQDDPNNNDNAKFHSLPWPPYKGVQNVADLVGTGDDHRGKGDSEEPADPELLRKQVTSPPGSNKRKRPMADESYRPRNGRDEESESEFDEAAAGTDVVVVKKARTAPTKKPAAIPEVAESAQTPAAATVPRQRKVSAARAKTPGPLKTPAKRGRPGRAVSQSAQK